jgi:hypothetical protein
MKIGRKFILITILFALGLTAFGLSQTFLHKTPSPQRTAVWFPIAIILKHYTTSELMMILGASLQFLLFALGLFYLVRRCRLLVAISILIVIYLLNTWWAMDIIASK